MAKLHRDVVDLGPGHLTAEVLSGTERAMWDQISDLHARHREVPVEIQLLKLTEETGEAAEAFIGMHGLNSRKGVCRSRDDLLAELADVIITAAWP
jgi:NTP pyrophosphatase (non-canonical NTP hydrolase)